MTGSEERISLTATQLSRRILDF